MLLDLKVGNYRSFRDPVTFSLAASNYDANSLPGNIMTPKLAGITKQKFLRGAAIYGANASGKSNLIRALFELQVLVRTSHQFEDGGGIPFDPFLLNHGSREEPTLYAIRFVSEGVRYHYTLAFTNKRVLEESLSAHPKGKPQLWYHRIWDDEDEIYHYTPLESEHFNLRKTDVESTKKNSLFLSTATSLNHPKLKPVYAWFRDKLSVMNLGIDGSHIGPSATVAHFERNPRKILNFLRRADLGITDVAVEKKPIPQKILDQLSRSNPTQNLEPEYVHITMDHSGEDGQLYRIPMEEESSGTSRFFQLIGPWLELIEQGKVLFLDELETSLHPLLTRELIRIVMDPELNKNKAQIIFATHDPLLLDTTLLRRDQIWLTEKTREGDSILYALNEYETPPSKRESLVRGYLSGRYGGIPYIPESLLSQELEPSEA